MWTLFRTLAPAKWVWVGEHSVLRGATAIAFPHPEFSLTLQFVPEQGESRGRRDLSGLKIEPEWARSVIEDLLKSVQDEQHEQGREFALPVGRLTIDSTIPSGAGLGSSAALCVAIARWLSEPLGIPEAGLLEFATHLEHRFHGKSSGMDVAVCAIQKPLSFVRGRGPTLLQPAHFPKVTFHDTGLRATTSECIRRVDELRDEDPVAGIRADELMSRASRLTLETLPRLGPPQGGAESLKKLGDALRMAHESFLIWRLVPASVQRLIEDLQRQGALGAKLTGAGGGGFVIAIWPE